MKKKNNILNDNKVKNRLKELAKIIYKNNILYHEKDLPEITDQEFDKYIKENDTLEKKFPHLSLKNSPNKTIGSAPSNKFKKIKHKSSMLSLSNSFNKKDLESFIQRIRKFLNIKSDKKITFLCEPKIDGLSLSLYYKKGKLISAGTRGDGTTGEDVTLNISNVFGIPKELENIDYPNEIEIRGEIFLNKEDFTKLNEKLDDKEKFSNPRNAAAGSLRQIDFNVSRNRPLYFIAHGLGFTEKKYECIENFYYDLKNWNIPVSEYVYKSNNIKSMIDYFNKIEKKRPSLGYDVDGIVFKTNEYSLQKRLGFVGKNPRWANALKFVAEKVNTKILDIDFQVGRTGAITPVARLESTNIGGVNITNATLHNFDEINKKDIRVGDIVQIQRAGDVIPQVIKVIKKKQNRNTPIVQPNKCPCCNGKTLKDKGDAILRCLNSYSCEDQIIGQLNHFVSKKSMNIDGFGGKQIKQFYNLNIVRKIDDIYNIYLQKEKIINLEGWGELSFNNLINSINKSKIIDLEKFVFAIGIRHVGETTSKSIAKEFIEIEEFIKNSINTEKLSLIDGLGPKAIDSIVDFFANKNNLLIINKLIKLITILKYRQPKSGSFYSNKNLVFTGTFKHLSREEAKHLAQEMGARISSNVSKNTDFLIIGEKPGSKHKKALDLNVNIITEKIWLQKIKE